MKNVLSEAAPGCYGDRVVKICGIDVPGGVPWVVCLFHGVYGTASLDDGNKYGELARKLANSGVSSCIVETSRDRRDRINFPDQAEWAEVAFSEKKYGQELFDHMSGLKVVSEVFADRSICLWGFSLGGIDSLMIAGRTAVPIVDLGLEVPIVPIERIGAVVASGSGDSLRSTSSVTTYLPILDSICDVDVLHRACGNIRKPLVRFFYGSLDETFDEPSSRRLFDLIPASDKSFSVVKGADHPFRNLYGIPSMEPLDVMVESVAPQLHGQPDACPR